MRRTRPGARRFLMRHALVGVVPGMALLLLSTAALADPDDWDDADDWNDEELAPYDYETTPPASLPTAQIFETELTPYGRWLWVPNVGRVWQPYEQVVGAG